MATNGEEKHPRVVIAGGGFGGLTCMNELRRSMPSADITLVEPNERFCFLPLLYEYLGGFADLSEIAPTYEFLLQQDMSKTKSGTLSMARGFATEVDPANKLIRIRRVPSGDIEQVPYDALLICEGLPPSKPKPNRPNIPSNAFSFSTLDDAVRLKRRIGALPTDAPSSIVVVGGGYVGSELACTLAKTVPSQTKITILHRDETGLCTGGESFNREAAQKRLDSLGVQVKLGTTVTNVQEGDSFDTVQYTNADGSEGSIAADVLIWTVGGATNKPRETTKGLPVNSRGRVMVSPTCQVQGMQNVYAVGDGAVVASESTPLYPATAQVAMQQASVAAYNIELDLEGKGDRTPKTFQYQSLGEMLSLGGDEDASISSLNGLFTLDGPLASTARRLVYAARMPAPKQVVRSGTEYVLGGVARRATEAFNLATEIVEKIAS